MQGGIRSGGAALLLALAVAVPVGLAIVTEQTGSGLDRGGDEAGEYGEDDHERDND